MHSEFNHAIQIRADGDIPTIIYWTECLKAEATNWDTSDAVKVKKLLLTHPRMRLRWRTNFWGRLG